MRNPLTILKIKAEERWLTLGIFVYLVALHALNIAKYFELFTQIKRFYWPHFIHNYHVSGFDPITYSIVSDWSAGYNVYRHPLLAFFMYPAYLVNQGLISLTGHNCAIFVVAVMQTFWAFFALIFLYRILREVVVLSRRSATVITLFFMSFAYVMVSAMVPDHFIISMMLLLLSLYIAGKQMQKGRELKTWQMVLYFILTAGTSLNNGLKVFLAALFTNRWRFFHWRNLVFGVFLPALALWGFARFEYAKFVWPTETARHETNKKRKEAKKKRDYEMQIAEQRKDSMLLAQGDTATVMAKRAAKANEEHKKAEAKKKKGPRQGAPIAKGEFMRWTDITSSRIDAIIENLFGESIQLHSDYLLGDVMRQRPMVVRYACWAQYVVEAAVLMLFFFGVWTGRKNRFLWLVLSYMGMDMALHVGLGFGINEVYIMSAHWFFAIPIAIAFGLKAVEGRKKLILEGVLGVLSLYLFVYNGALLVKYFL